MCVAYWRRTRTLTSEPARRLEIFDFFDKGLKFFPLTPLKMQRRRESSRQLAFFSHYFYYLNVWYRFRVTGLLILGTELESFRNKDGDSRENVFLKNKLACFSNCTAYIRHIPTHLNSCQRCVNLPVDEFLGLHPSLERERKIIFCLISSHILKRRIMKISVVVAS